MIGVYFSGTGNTKFCVDKFLKEYNCSKNSFSIEDNNLSVYFFVFQKKYNLCPNSPAK